MKSFEIVFVDGELYFGWWWNTYSPFHVSPSITSLSSRVATRSKLRHQLNRPLLFWTFVFILIFLLSHPHIRVSVDSFLFWTIYQKLLGFMSAMSLIWFVTDASSWNFAVELLDVKTHGARGNCSTKKSFPKAHLFPCSLIIFFSSLVL